ncbi:MAG: helix-turn-helix domain-containing protein [Oliverpabstia sp.]
MIILKITYRIYEERKKKNLSVRKLAEKSGVSKTHISDIENGNTHPTVYTLCLLSLALGVDPCSLFILSDISDK